VNVSQQGQQVSISFGGDGKVWQPVIDDANAALNDAQAVLAAE
jgi:hypothetical protein